MAVQPIPDGYNTVTPYLIINGAKDAIEFYKQAFGATEVLRLNRPTGDIAHAEIKIGDCKIMLAESCSDSSVSSPENLGGTTIAIHLYVEDVDAIFEQAIDAGALDLKSVEDQFYGDRTGTLQDPFGHIWFIATHKEELTLEEIQKRAGEIYGV